MTPAQGNIQAQQRPTLFFKRQARTGGNIFQKIGRLFRGTTHEIVLMKSNSDGTSTRVAGFAAITLKRGVGQNSVKLGSLQTKYELIKYGGDTVGLPRNFTVKTASSSEFLKLTQDVVNSVLELKDNPNAPELATTDVTSKEDHPLGRVASEGEKKNTTTLKRQIVAFEKAQVILGLKEEKAAIQDEIDALKTSNTFFEEELFELTSGSLSSSSSFSEGDSIDFTSTEHLSRSSSRGFSSAADADDEYSAGSSLESNSSASSTPRYASMPSHQKFSDEQAKKKEIKGKEEELVAISTKIATLTADLEQYQAISQRISDLKIEIAKLEAKNTTGMPQTQVDNLITLLESKRQENWQLEKSTRGASWNEPEPRIRSN